VVTYDFKDPKGVNAVSITLDSPLEPMAGYANAVEGSVTVDTTARKIVKGRVTVAASSISMSNGTMTKVLHSKPWLDTEKYPNITFDYINTIAVDETLDDKYTFTVQGTLTIAGVSQQISVPVSLSFQKDRAKERVPGTKGDLAILRSSFDINRNAFNINTSAPEALVSNTIHLTLNIAGMSSPAKK
jgi:polyisoprenoid-binding protein YceI